MRNEFLSIIFSATLHRSVMDFLMKNVNPIFIKNEYQRELLCELKHTYKKYGFDICEINRCILSWYIRTGAKKMELLYSAMDNVEYCNSAAYEIVKKYFFY